jgi:hypothetical protein
MTNDPSQKGTDMVPLTFINLTAHVVRVYDADDTILLEVPSSGTVARLQDQWSEPELITGTIPVRHLTPTTKVLNLPDRQPGVAYIVSRLLAAAQPTRTDLFFPGLEVRDDHGQILGCRWLGQVSGRDNTD